MSIRGTLQEPQPLLLNNPSEIRKQSATHRTNRSTQRNQSGKVKDANQQLALELKKIQPSDLSNKNMGEEGEVKRKRNHTHTGSSDNLIRQYQDYRLGTNPEINERLSELTQKINLIEYRQLKMQTGSKSQERLGSKNSQMRLMSKSAGTRINDVSKIVFKELKTVKNDIHELKEMMETIRESKDEENFKTNKNHSKSTALDRGRLNKVINTNIKFSQKMNPKKSHKIEFDAYKQPMDMEEEQRTIYFHTKLTDPHLKVITLGPQQQPEEIEFMRKPKATSAGKSKTKRLRNTVSVIPRGLSHKNFRVTKNISKKDLNPYLDSKNSKGMSRSQTMKSTANKNILTNDIISMIQANLQTEDKSKKLTVLPKLPDGFNPMLNSEELLSLAKKVLVVFNVQSNWSKPINIKKFKNCVHFSHLNTNILWHYDGKFYIGGWNQQGEGNKEGYGIESIPQKYVYQGQFQKGKRNGFGIMTSFNGESYKGYWANGYRHGRGKQEQVSGYVYEGEWVLGKKEGYGRLSFSKKEFYEGMWKDGVKNGIGKEIFKNGDAYQGQYLNDKFNGAGIYRWTTGASYNGSFKDGERHGKGTWIADSSKKSDSYEGTYENDLKTGMGKYTWANGSTYIGNFSKDQKNGQGTIFYNDGKILQAIWEDGHMIQKLYSQKPRRPTLSGTKRK